MNTESELLMQRCLELARNGTGQVAPNPMVGALIVANGEVIGAGYHESFGAPHAEREAIKNVTKRELLTRSCLYVNLEPCCHQGRTPPCTKAIIEAGIPRVLIGARDPNPLVGGQGIAELRTHGLQIEESVLEKECRLLNKRFYTYHQKQRPYVILKWAQTEDGYIARSDHSSRWISAEESRRLVHAWRAEESAVLVGTNTAVYDNPQLTVRHCEGKNPLRLLMDRELRVSTESALHDQRVETWIFNRKKEAQVGTCRWVRMDFGEDILSRLLSYLYEQGILSLMVEGGALLLNSFLSEELWDEARIFVAPKRFGAGIAAPKIERDACTVSQIGSDKLYTYIRE